MFNPDITSKAKITMQNGDGTSCELEGFVNSLSLASDDGVQSATVEFVSSGPVVFDGDFVPDPPPAGSAQTITEVDIRGGSLVFDPPPAPPNETTTGDSIYRPWSPETTMIVAMAAITPVVYALVRCVLWALTR